MIDRFLEPSVAAIRLSVSTSTIQRMFRAGILQGIRTGPAIPDLR